MKMKSTSHDIKKKIIERNSKSSPGKNIQKYKKTKQKHNNNQKHKTPVSDNHTCNQSKYQTYIS